MSVIGAGRGDLDEKGSYTKVEVGIFKDHVEHLLLLVWLKKHLAQSHNIFVL